MSGHYRQVSVAQRNLKCDVISNVTRKCLHRRSATSVISNKINGCVLFMPFACNCKGHLARKSVHVLVSICTDHVSNTKRPPI